MTLENECLELLVTDGSTLNTYRKVLLLKTMLNPSLCDLLLKFKFSVDVEYIMTWKKLSSIWVAISPVIYWSIRSSSMR